MCVVLTISTALTPIINALKEILRLHKASSEMQEKEFDAQSTMTQKLLDSFDMMM
jgi:hypothetical protein